MLESHLVSDFCLIGPKGCGKSITVQTLANLLGYEVEPVVLYQASIIIHFFYFNSVELINSIFSKIFYYSIKIY